jgi:alpha-D-xyloside xylohydrolase
MAELKIEGNRLVRRFDRETLYIEPWGASSLRVRATRRSHMENTDWALLPPEPCPDARISIEGRAATITNGGLTACINQEGWLRFLDLQGKVLLGEYWRDRRDRSRFTSPLNLSGREFLPALAGDHYRITQRFEASPDEKIFGLGQYQEPYLDKKGSSLELAHRNAQCSVPFALSNRGYGFLYY